MKKRGWKQWGTWLRDKLKKIWGNWRFSWLFLAVIFLTNLTAIWQLYWYEGRSLTEGACRLLLLEGLLRVAGLSLLLTLCCGFFTRWLRYLLAGGSLFLAGVDIFMLRHYHSVLDAGLLQVILATNPAEAREYLVSQAGDILPFVLVLLVIVLAGVIYRRYFKRPGRGQAGLAEKNAGLPAGCVRQRPSHSRHLLQAMSVFLLALFSMSVCRAYEDPEEHVAKIPQMLSLGRLAANLEASYEEIGSTAYVDYTLASHEVEILEDHHDLPQVVFILGESTSRHHMQLYGYDLPTTPKLMARRDNGELAVFSQVTSPHAGTMAVMRTLFSFYDNEAPGLWYEYGNVFDIFRKAGIHTAWLSNQESSGFYGSIGKTLAGRCDDQAFTSHLSHTIDLSERYDEEILPLLDLQMAADDGFSGSSFYVLHLMGAHEDFKRRYPASYARFMADDEEEKSGNGEEAKQLRAEYDNAVLYDDAVVDAIIKRFEARDAIVIFLSDHGEEVYDVRDLFGHGDESSAWQREIPMVIWMSPMFQQRHADDAARIRRATEKKWQSDEMIHTLLDLYKIRVPDFEAGKSLLS